jgi:extracellular matrix regulatory protein A
MLDIGFKNFIMTDRIMKVIPPKTANARWIIKEAVANKKVINCTHGGKTKSIIILDSHHIILSNLKCSSILSRIEEYNNNFQLTKASVNVSDLSAGAGLSADSSSSEIEADDESEAEEAMEVN